MQTKQIPLRLSEALLADLDALVADGAYRSRAAAIRAGIQAILHKERQRQIDREIIDGYARHPQTEAEKQTALASMRQAIEEEPW
ncbi:MAG: ribbon-helix-helix domain-containing protein [bacterium]|nr:ribbon-helix-helix domain-containing protein [bacterium]MCY4271158.1 ribbon-helix-helix domain-containing protein [bacterium]